MWSSAFFSPCLYPVLEGGERDKDAVVTPQVPTGGPIRQTVFNHQTDGCVYDTEGVVGVRQGQVQHIGVEIVSTGQTAMLRVDYLQLARPPGHRVAQIVEHPMGRPKPIRPVSASGARASWIIAGPSDDLRRGEILDTPDAFRGIGHIASRAIHDHLSKRSFSRRYRPIPGPKVRKSSVTMLQCLYNL